jgi:L-amino acid N-acyltransferase YncA
MAVDRFVAWQEVSMKKNEANHFPRRMRCDATELTLRFMTAADADAVLAFAAALPPHDLLFLQRDIRNPKVVAAWVGEIARGAITSVLAVAADGIVHGCVAIVRDELSWSSHVGELRVVVSQAMRGTGLGRVLVQDAFALAIERGIAKIMARTTPDQRGAIAVFQELGFRGEALLRDHVRDVNGMTHDIVIFSLDIARHHAQLEAYGYNEAF